MKFLAKIKKISDPENEMVKAERDKNVNRIIQVNGENEQTVNYEIT